MSLQTHLRSNANANASKSELSLNNKNKPALNSKNNASKHTQTIMTKPNDAQIHEKMDPIKVRYQFMQSMTNAILRCHKKHPEFSKTDAEKSVFIALDYDISIETPNIHNNNKHKYFLSQIQHYRCNHIMRNRTAIRTFRIKQVYDMISNQYSHYDHEDILKYLTTKLNALYTLSPKPKPKPISLSNAQNNNNNNNNNNIMHSMENKTNCINNNNQNTHNNNLQKNEHKNIKNKSNENIANNQPIIPNKKQLPHKQTVRGTKKCKSSNIKQTINKNLRYNKNETLMTTNNRNYDTNKYDMERIYISLNTNHDHHNNNNNIYHHQLTTTNYKPPTLYVNVNNVYQPHNNNNNNDEDEVLLKIREHHQRLNKQKNNRKRKLHENKQNKPNKRVKRSQYNRQRNIKRSRHNMHRYQYKMDEDEDINRTD